MKKLSAFVFLLVCMLSLTSCGDRAESHTVEIIIPAGSTDAFIYSKEEISPLKDTLTITAGAGISETEVILKTVTVKEKTAYEPAVLTQTKPVKMNVEKGGWFKIGVAIQNPSDKNITVAVKVENVKIKAE